MARWCRGYWSSQGRVEGRVEKGWNWVAECNNLRERYTRKNVLFLRWRESATFPRMFSSSADEVFKRGYRSSQGRVEGSATLARMSSSSAGGRALHSQECFLPPLMKFLKYPSSEALGQVPGGSGLGVNADDHGVLANGMADGVEKGRTV